jgi:hypothetical protein
VERSTQGDLPLALSDGAWNYMSQIHAHRFGLGDSIGSAGPSNGQVQNLYNKGSLDF